MLKKCDVIKAKLTHAVPFTLVSRMDEPLKFVIITHLSRYDAFSYHSQTCVQRPPLGPKICGRCSKVPLCNENGPENCRCRQVVIIRSWSSAQV